MILKTYARVVTRDAEQTLEALEQLTGRTPDVRFVAGAIEVIAIADFCIIGAADADVAKLREVIGPVVVDNLAEVQQSLLRQGAEVTLGPLEAPTGTVLYARNKDGIVMEWLQYTPEITDRLFPKYQLQGTGR